jgi:hypothetical protein
MRRRDTVWIALLSAATGLLIGMGLAANARVPVPAGSHAIPSLPFGPQGGVGTAPFAPGVPAGPHGSVQGTDLLAAPGTRLLDWGLLRAFDYVPGPGLDALPAEIRAYDGARVTMVGYLMPTCAYEDIREFSLVGSPWSCHFGDVAGLSGIVQVGLHRGHVGLDLTMEPLCVVGTFRVREARESDWLIAIFHLDDAKAEMLR